MHRPLEAKQQQFSEALVLDECILNSHDDGITPDDG